MKKAAITSPVFSFPEDFLAVIRQIDDLLQEADKVDAAVAANAAECEAARAALDAASRALADADTHVALGGSEPAIAAKEREVVEARARADRLSRAAESLAARGRELDEQVAEARNRYEMEIGFVNRDIVEVFVGEVEKCLPSLHRLVALANAVANATHDRSMRAFTARLELLDPRDALCEIEGPIGKLFHGPAVDCSGDVEAKALRELLAPIGNVRNALSRYVEFDKRHAAPASPYVLRGRTNRGSTEPVVAQQIEVEAEPFEDEGLTVEATEEAPPKKPAVKRFRSWTGGPIQPREGNSMWDGGILEQL